MKLIDTTNMCSHLQRKLFAPDGEYRAIREQIETDPTLTAVVRSRQLHIYRDGISINANLCQYANYWRSAHITGMPGRSGEVTAGRRLGMLRMPELNTWKSAAILNRFRAWCSSKENPTTGANACIMGAVEGEKDGTAKRRG